MKFWFLGLAFLTACAGHSVKDSSSSSASQSTGGLPASIEAAVSSNYRSPENRARDRYRPAPLTTLPVPLHRDQPAPAARLGDTAFLQSRGRFRSLPRLPNSGGQIGLTD